MINSLARGLKILRELAHAAGPLGVTEIGERLKVDPSTSYRLLATLEVHGFVRQESNKKYTLGFGALEISAALLGQLDIAAIASPRLHTLAAVTAESTHLAVRDRTRAVFVAHAAAVGILRVDTPVGSSEPLYCTAVGKALLMDFDEPALARFIRDAPLEKYTAQTITSLDLLVIELERSRARGYAFDDEELHPGVRCVAVPIRNHLDRIVASVGLSAPASRLTREHLPALITAVQAAAYEISYELGHPSPPVTASL